MAGAFVRKRDTLALVSALQLFQLSFVSVQTLYVLRIDQYYMAAPHNPFICVLDVAEVVEESK